MVSSNSRKHTTKNGLFIILFGLGLILNSGFAHAEDVPRSEIDSSDKEHHNNEANLVDSGEQDEQDQTPSEETEISDNRLSEEVMDDEIDATEEDFTLTKEELEQLAEILQEAQEAGLLDNRFVKSVDDSQDFAEEDDADYSEFEDEEVQGEENVKEIVTLPDMVGELPRKVQWLLTKFNNQRGMGKLFLNRLLLYGPPGNGKSMMARQLAKATNAVFIARSACSMVERYVGQGATNVVELFERAYKEINQGKKVVVFVDEVDALATANTTEFRSEHKAALQQLWIELDKCKNEPNVFVVFATNEFKRLSKTFLDRFGCNTVEIGMPRKAMRTKIITYYADLFELELSENILAKLAKKTKGLSNRALEDLVRTVKMAADLEHNGEVAEKMLWPLVKQLQKKFKDNISEQEEKEDKWWERFSRKTGAVHSTLAIATTTITLHKSIFGSTLERGFLGTNGFKNFVTTYFAR